ncbi:MAG: hypothetical protein KGZ72_14710 [Roseovarius sp.]|jgi:hypothetical protein|nr:hypothetical protein [Roseovarius sp.]
MGTTSNQRRRNFRAARLRQKLRIRRAILDERLRDNVSSLQCDLLDTGHAVANAAGHPSPEAQEKAPPETGAVFSDARPKDDEGQEHEHSAS